MRSTLEPFIDLIELKSFVAVCRNPNYNFLRALAQDGKVDYLRTGDKNPLELVKYSKTKIETISSCIGMK